MLRLAFDFIITWKKTRTRPNAYSSPYFFMRDMEEERISMELEALINNIA